MGGGDAQLPQQASQVGGELRNLIGPSRLVRAAMAAQVEVDDLITLGKLRHLRLPVAGAGAQAVDQHDGLAEAAGFVVKVDLVSSECWHDPELPGAIRPSSRM